MRPSASQIVSISCAPEFTHLIDVIMLPYNDHILSTAAVFSGKPTGRKIFTVYILDLLPLSEWNFVVLFQQILQHLNCVLALIRQWKC